MHQSWGPLWSVWELGRIDRVQIATGKESLGSAELQCSCVTVCARESCRQLSLVLIWVIEGEEECEGGREKSHNYIETETIKRPILSLQCSSVAFLDTSELIETESDPPWHRVRSPRSLRYFRSLRYSCSPRGIFFSKVLLSLPDPGMIYLGSEVRERGTSTTGWWISLLSSCWVFADQCDDSTKSHSASWEKDKGVKTLLCSVCRDELSLQSFRGKTFDESFWQHLCHKSPFFLQKSMLS